MKIIISENQLNLIKELINPTVLYSAVFVDKNYLLNKYQPIYQNIYYDHSTIEFKPGDISNLPIGKKIKLKIIGRLTTDKVDVLLVDNPLSKNVHPHITLSTNEGIKPYESNKEISGNIDKIIKINGYVDGIVGYCDKSTNIITEENVIKKSPDKILDGDKNVIVSYLSTDAIAFGFKNGKAYVGYNNNLHDNIKGLTVEDNKELEYGPDTHGDIMTFYSIIYHNKNFLHNYMGRDEWEYPGRLWFNHKIISFWLYPNKDELPILLKKISNEIKNIYNINITFDDYEIEIKEPEYSEDFYKTFNDDDEQEIDYDWYFSKKRGNLIPIKNFLGSQNTSAEEMAKMHTMPSAQKRETPQMKAALDDKYKIIGKKLGGVPMAQYNHYKRYGMGENINIPVSTGDTILTGKFKNHKEVVKDIDSDEYNMPTINGKKATTFRILNKSLNEIKENEVNLSSFELKKDLNPKIWDDKKLNRKVRLRLLKIADDFLDFINVDSKYCKDVLFLGSLANYNWSKYSDIDLHLLIDFKKINKDVNLVKDYFDSKRKIWNDEHEMLKIYGFPIEVYIQDINENNESVGVFSVEKNKWIKEPNENMNGIKDYQIIKIKSADLMTKIDDLKSRYDKKPNIDEIEKISKSVKTLFDKIKHLRKIGLASKNGEFSTGNIIFKVLRRTGYIEKLVDLKRNTYDKINTIK